MTPEQKIKAIILGLIAAQNGDAIIGLTDENIESEWESAHPNAIQDAKYEVRYGEVETGIDCDSSRHYESKSVAAQAPDGSWVGWTYWYGGGKHGEPEAMEWMDEAYDLTCAEEVQTVTVRTFTRAA